jgi:hypothetical protein
MSLPVPSLIKQSCTVFLFTVRTFRRLKYHHSSLLILPLFITIQSHLKLHLINNPASVWFWQYIQITFCAPELKFSPEERQEWTWGREDNSAGDRGRGRSHARSCHCTVTLYSFIEPHRSVITGQTLESSHQHCYFTSKLELTNENPAVRWEYIASWQNNLSFGQTAIDSIKPILGSLSRLDAVPAAQGYQLIYRANSMD